MKDLRDRIAVVTGAASGIGRAMAERFAAAGMKVVLADIQRDALHDTEAAIRATGAQVTAVLADVARAADVEALARKTLDAFGAVHVVCNNAGVSVGGHLWERSVADWEWILGVNLWGVIHGVRVFVPIMLEQSDEGHIVNTASMAGLTSTPGLGPYNVTKHGVVTLSEVLFHELAAASAGRIKVSVLCPGWVNTRILESERNRPTDSAPGVQRPEMQFMQEQIRQLLQAGLDPRAVAEQVLDAIHTDRFYVLTHRQWKPMIEQRMHDILEERPPTLRMPA
ncbi:MAG: SDR family NAD(P)-dependent oxidoreductase [Candidatus Binatia bacterium]